MAFWIASIENDLHEKLAGAGLVEPRTESTEVPLGLFVERFIADRSADVEERTVINWKGTKAKLREFFGEDVSLSSIRADKAEEYARWLRRKLARATAAGHIKRAKQFLRQAVREKLIPSNPFEDIVAGLQENPERKHFIPSDVIEKVIDQCPDAEWRLLIALSRYGGLRNPSETLNLKWQDIDSAIGIMRVTSPKTKKQGKGFRIVPIFRELARYIDEAHECAHDGSVYCINRYRSQDVNLRTQFLRFIKRAGEKPWGRLWHNLRASLETKLANEFPLHVVTVWLGNTPRVAERHYLQVTPEHIARATGRVVQGVVHTPPETNENGQKPASVEPLKSRGFVESLGNQGASSYAWADSNCRPTV